LDLTGQIKPFISVSPLITTGIHVTNNNDIMLGVMEKDAYKLTDKSCRKIIVFGENKKEKQFVSVMSEILTGISLIVWILSSITSFLIILPL
jgi:hypothetical protein